MQIKSILIDDDKLIHWMWGIEAKKAGVELECFFSVESFLSSCKEISTDSVIYIDSDLGNGIKGEKESRKIFDLGFQKIYLATNYEADQVDKPNWIIEVRGKKPNFNS